METRVRPALALKRVRLLFHGLHPRQCDAIRHVGQKAHIRLRFGCARRYRFFIRHADPRAQTLDPREFHKTHGGIIDLFLGRINVGRMDLQTGGPFAVGHVCGTTHHRDPKLSGRDANSDPVLSSRKPHELR